MSVAHTSCPPYGQDQLCGHAWSRSERPSPFMEQAFSKLAPALTTRISSRSQTVVGLNCHAKAPSDSPFCYLVRPQREIEPPPTLVVTQPAGSRWQSGCSPVSNSARPLGCSIRENPAIPVRTCGCADPRHFLLVRLAILLVAGDAQEFALCPAKWADRGKSG